MFKIEFRKRVHRDKWDSLKHMWVARLRKSLIPVERDETMLSVNFTYKEAKFLHAFSPISRILIQVFELICTLPRNIIYIRNILGMPIPNLLSPLPTASLVHQQVQYKFNKSNIYFGVSREYLHPYAATMLRSDIECECANAYLYFRKIIQYQKVRNTDKSVSRRW